MKGVDFAQLNITLAGKLGMIVAWYFDGKKYGVSEDALIASGLIRDVIPRAIRDKRGGIIVSDLFLLLDALESFPFRDKEVEECYGCLQCIDIAYRAIGKKRKLNDA